MGFGIVLKFIQYRLSRVHIGGQNFINYNRVILYTPEHSIVSTRFVEGFGAKEFIVEAANGTHQFRKQTSLPQMLYDFDKFKVIGDEIKLPQIRSQLSITPAPAGFQINEEQDVFSCKFRDIDASWGDTIEAYNSEELGTNTNVEFYDRDVRRVPGKRDITETRPIAKPTPPPEPMTEKLLDEM